MAPGFTPEALAVFKTKVNVRSCKLHCHPVAPPPGIRAATSWMPSAWAQGLLLQTSDIHELKLSDLKVVTKVQPPNSSCKTCCLPGRWPLTSRAMPSCSAPTA